MPDPGRFVRPRAGNRQPQRFFAPRRLNSPEPLVRGVMVGQRRQYRGAHAPGRSVPCGDRLDCRPADRLGGAFEVRCVKTGIAKVLPVPAYSGRSDHCGADCCFSSPFEPNPTAFRWKRERPRRLSGQELIRRPITSVMTPGADRLAAFPDGEVAADVEGHRLVQADDDGGVVAGHDHLDSVRQTAFRR